MACCCGCESCECKERCVCSAGRCNCDLCVELRKDVICDRCGKPVQCPPPEGEAAAAPPEAAAPPPEAAAPPEGEAASAPAMLHSFLTGYPGVRFDQLPELDFLPKISSLSIDESGYASRRLDFGDVSLNSPEPREPEMGECIRFRINLRISSGDLKTEESERNSGLAHQCSSLFNPSSVSQPDESILNEAPDVPSSPSSESCECNESSSLTLSGQSPPSQFSVSPQQQATSGTSSILSTSAPAASSEGRPLLRDSMPPLRSASASPRSGQTLKLRDLPSLEDMSISSSQSSNTSPGPAGATSE